jgi:hypothetical protein
VGSLISHPPDAESRRTTVAWARGPPNHVTSSSRRGYREQEMRSGRAGRIGAMEATLWDGNDKLELVYSSTQIHSNIPRMLPSGWTTFWNTNLLSTLSANSFHSSRSLSVPLYKRFMTRGSFLCCCSNHTGCVPGAFMTRSMMIRRVPCRITGRRDLRIRRQEASGQQCRMSRNK